MKTAIFDIGNVLVFFSYPRMFTQISALTGIPKAEIEEDIIEKAMGIYYEDGSLSDDALYAYFTARSPRKFSQQELKLAIADIFTENTDIYPLVYALKAQGVKLLLLSNTCPAHIEFLKDRFAIFQAFDGEILSFEAGLRKPDFGIYHKALELAGMGPQDCFYVDDIAAYVQAARSLGIRAEAYTTVEQLQSHLSAYGYL